jgi:DNA helicase II / ATP-dependent DNA helicase PcrA
LADLNDIQQKAAQHKEGPMLVLAGAGSGKTRIVTYRILHLLNTGVRPSEILALTFTNKAAGEMKERLFQASSSPVLVTTFHSLGARLLREYAEGFLGLKESFAIYDENDSERLIKACLDEMGIKDKRLSTKAVRARISNAKNALESPSEFSVEEPTDEKVKQLYSIYERRLREYNAVDFDDLLYLVARLLKERSDVLEAIQDRFKYFLIDEYQDTNHAQYSIAKMLSSKSKNLFVVGDPDQSIYSWRGANIGNILNFEKDFPGAEVIKLEQNYRSSENILEAANGLIQENESRYEKNLWSALGPGEKVAVHVLDTEYSEADFVLGNIQEQLAKGVPYNEIAILYRTNAQSRSIEDACLNGSIPYVVIGGISFYQRKEIKDALSFLRLIASPVDFMSFQRVVKALKLSVGDTSLSKIQSALSVYMESAASAQRTLWALIDKVIDCPSEFAMRLGQKQRDDLMRLKALFQNLTDYAQEASVAQVLQEAIDQSHYMSILRLDPDTFEDRKENLDSLLAKATDFEMDEDPSLLGFLNDIALKTNLDEGSALHGRIRLMTMHNAKGLEFEVVYLVGMEEDLFPHVNSKGDFTKLEEERRLCYVGMTRAKKKLFLTSCKKRNVWGASRMMLPSRFLSELPDKHIERHGSHSFDYSYGHEHSGNFSRRLPENFRHSSLRKSTSSTVRSVPKESFEPGEVFEVGDTISHPDFGKGQIKNVYEGSFGWMYDVVFSNGDEKTLVAKFAPLSRA